MKDNKKKLVVIAALALVIVFVGVFQFVAGTSGPVPKMVAKAEDKKVTADKAKTSDLPKNPLFANDLKGRDPFEIGTLPTDPTTAKPTTPAPTPAPAEPKARREPRETVLPPVRLTGELPSGPMGASSLALQAEPQPKFGFIVSGVMLGAKPMAVFTDAQGSQRLIMLGGSLGPDSSVVSIDKDAVTVRFHGKTLRLTVEGNPNAK